MNQSPPRQELNHEGQNPEDERRYRGALRQIPSVRFVQSSSLAGLLVHCSNYERIARPRAELLHVLMLPTLSDRIGEFWGYRRAAPSPSS